MGILTDLLQGIPLNAVLREQLAAAAKRNEELEAELAALRADNTQLKSQLEEPRPDASHFDDADIISVLESHLRKMIMSSQPIEYAKLDQKFRFPDGSAKRLIEQAAKKWSLRTVRKGSSVISFEWPRSERGPLLSPRSE